MTVLRAGGATNVGQIREVNQDSLLMAPHLDLFGVADGIGGNQGGEVASEMATDIVADRATERTPENLLEAVVDANRLIFSRSGSSPRLLGMGTTFVGVQLMPDENDVLGDELCWINVGDSRIYLFRDGELIQLSRDHSLVEELVREGAISPEEARIHPQRNIITRSLGVDIDVRADLGTVAPIQGDRLLLCSDGLTNEVTDEQMAAVLRRLADPEEAAEELVRLAYDHGGRDNITVVVIDVEDDGGRSLAASEALAHEPLTAGSVPMRTLTIDPDGEIVEAGRRRAPITEASEAADTDPPIAPVDDDGDEAEEPDPFRTRRVTWRVLAFAFAFLAIIAATIGGIGWTARNSWFVGYDESSRVALYRGKPGGVLFFDPELVQITDLDRDDVAALYQADLEAGKAFTSEEAAQRYVQSLQHAGGPADPDGSDDTTPPRVTTTTTTDAGTTTTTVAATTTTAR